MVVYVVVRGADVAEELIWLAASAVKDFLRIVVNFDVLIRPVNFYLRSEGYIVDRSGRSSQVKKDERFRREETQCSRSNVGHISWRNICIRRESSCA